METKEGERLKIKQENINNDSAVKGINAKEDQT
jgi:hypothetical protein